MLDGILLHITHKCILFGRNKIKKQKHPYSKLIKTEAHFFPALFVVCVRPAQLAYPQNQIVAKDFNLDFCKGKKMVLNQDLHLGSIMTMLEHPHQYVQIFFYFAHLKPTFIKYPHQFVYYTHLFKLNIHFFNTVNINSERREKGKESEVKRGERKKE